METFFQWSIFVYILSVPSATWIMDWAWAEYDGNIPVSVKRQIKYIPVLNTVVVILFLTVWVIVLSVAIVGFISDFFGKKE